jgi:hypothetical protein
MLAIDRFMLAILSLHIWLHRFVSEIMEIALCDFMRRMLLLV